MHLNHTACQYRETQGHESTRFISYFKENGYKILSGTSLKSTSNFPRLYQIAGKTCPICIQKKTLAWLHFNSGNVMILQTKNIIFVWIGRSSSSTERINGLKIATKFKDELNISEMTIVDDGYEQSMMEIKKAEWNEYLNLSQRLVHPLVVKPPALQPHPIKLYHCDSIGGVFRVEMIKSDVLVQGDLFNRSSAYIIDCMPKGVWIWIGRNKTKPDKAEAMRHARGFVIKVLFLDFLLYGF